MLRVFRLGDLPAGLHCDEAAFGYNAWALLHHGMDENGERFPLFLWSFFGYKNPVFLYASMLPIGVLGLSEFSLRLTAALFGTGTVVALFFLGRALAGPALGLLAAALLAVCPWHLHFSRIAYELISFPLLFAIGVTLLVRFAQGRRTLVAAAFLLGACFYAYAIAKLFVPLFLAGFALLYRRELGRRRREACLAAAAFLLTVAPVVAFDLRHRDRSGSYFRDSSILRPGVPASQVAARLAGNYVRFFSPEFLFRSGDPLTRHAVRGHGELPRSWAPLLALGLLAIAAVRERVLFLPLLWLLLYPLGASLMNEIPSASRGFIGAPAFTLLAAYGLLSAGTLLRRARPWLVPAGLAVFAGIAALETRRYWHLYTQEYPTYAAAGLGGFQYGYRELVRAMEPQRARYPELLWTTTEVNQPYILALFYRPIDPRVMRATRDAGFRFLDPASFDDYAVPPPVLYALREPELSLFTDVDVQRRVVAPGGQTEFVIAEVRERKRYLSGWSVLGPFASEEKGRGFLSPPAAPPRFAAARYPGKFGDVAWEPCAGPTVRVDLRECLGARDTEHPGDPQDLCAYARSTVRSAAARQAVLEVSGAAAAITAWWNGAELGSLGPLAFADTPRRVTVPLPAGESELVVGSCLELGDWAIAATLLEENGKNLSATTP